MLLLTGCVVTSASPTGAPTSAVSPVGGPTTQPSPAISPTPSGPDPSPSPTCEHVDRDMAWTVKVPGRANIFGAGRDTAPEPGGGGAGTLPSMVQLPVESIVVTVPCVTGQVTPFVGQPLFNGPNGDRQGAGGSSTDVTSFQGISGIINRGNGMFLVGVFLTDVEPPDPAPERLDFTDNEDFAELAPEIGQTFFIGDGIGRSFRVPAGATRLFLGFADAFRYEGAPGWYDNNAGSFEVTVAAE